MWLPFTSRTEAGALAWTTAAATSATQGPAALTSTRARMLRRVPVASSRRTMVQAPSVRTAETQLVRGAIVAPQSAASRAFSTTRRESSTQQSE